MSNAKPTTLTQEQLDSMISSSIAELEKVIFKKYPELREELETSN